MSVRLVALLVLNLFTLTAAPLSWAADPGRVIVEAVDKGLSILHSPEFQGKDKLPARREQLWKELSPFFDFEEMSKRSLSRHWRERSDAEKQEFIGLFTDLLKDAYLGKSDAYSGQRIVYLSEQCEGKRCTVQTNFITASKEAIAVDFQMMDRTDKWMIYDVVIEGVSLINNYRSQFNSILLRSSYDELVKKIKNKHGIEVPGEEKTN